MTSMISKTFTTLIICLQVFFMNLYTKAQITIDPEPIFSMQLENGFNLKSTLQNSNNLAEYKYVISPRYENLMLIKALNDTVEYLLRIISIYQFSTMEEATKEYNSLKKTYLEQESSHVFEEKEKLNNKYYILHRTKRLEYNHGIPYATNEKADVWVGFVLNNYFIYITFTDMRFEKTFVDYNKFLNDDINNTAKFFKDALKSQNSDK